MSSAVAAFLAAANVVMSLLFAMEMVIKHCAFGLVGYWAEPFNRFDGVIVLFSLLDILSTYVDLLPPDAPAFTVLRAFRLLRVFRLLRSWPGLQSLLGALLSSLTELFYLMALLAVFLFIFALLGMQLFGDQYVPPAFAEPPRANFDSITSAMITVFTVAISEGWDRVWMDTKVAVGFWSAPFFVVLVVLANFIMVNLVVATLISTFDAQAAEERKKRQQQEYIEEGEDEAQPENHSGPSFFKRRSSQDLHSSASSTMQLLLRNEAALQEEVLAKAAAGGGGGQAPASPPWQKPKSPPPSPPESSSAAAATSSAAAPPGAAASAEPSPETLSPPPSPPTAAGYAQLRDEAGTPPPRRTPPSSTRRAGTPPRTPPRTPKRAGGGQEAGGGQPSCFGDDSDVSLCLFGPDHLIRRAAHALVTFEIRGTALTFDNLIVVFIIVSSVSMTFDSCELDATSAFAKKLALVDLVAVCVFLAELVGKVIAMGLLTTPNAYLKDSWNRLDMFIVGASLFSMFGNSSPAFRALRVLRVLRPLRLISRFSGMRMAVNLLLRAMPAVLGALPHPPSPLLLPLLAANS